MSRLSTTLAGAAITLSLGSIACGNKPPMTTTPPTPSADTMSGASAHPEPQPQPQKTSEEAHKFVMLATACWFGGLWADAEGEKGDAKTAAMDSRCTDVVKKVYGADDKAKLDALRSFDAKAVSDVAAAVEKIAANDSIDGPRKDNLIKLTTAIADAQRELSSARRAGDKVRRDEDAKDRGDKLTKDEQEAVPAMRAHAAMDALFKLDVGDLTKEAHAIGILCVMDRVNISRGLPRHLKIYTVGDAFKTLFNVDVPATVPDDVTKPLKQGLWVTYLAGVAKAAGHAVPEKQMKSPVDSYALAWAGVLQGIADKLAAEGDGISPNTELQKVVLVVKSQLEKEYRTEVEAHPGKPVAPPPPPGKKI